MTWCGEMCTFEAKAAECKESKWCLDVENIFSTVLIINYRRKQKQQLATLDLSIESLQFLMTIPTLSMWSFHCTESWMEHMCALICNLRKTCDCPLWDCDQWAPFLDKIYTPHSSSTQASASLFTETTFNHIPRVFLAFSHWKWSWGINSQDCEAITMCCFYCRHPCICVTFSWCCCSACISSFHEQMRPVLHKPACLGDERVSETTVHQRQLRSESTSEENLLFCCLLLWALLHKSILIS